MYRRYALLNQPNPAHLRRAIALATENVLSGKGGPFAAVIVRDGEVIAEAANSVTTSNDPTAHGEVNAIRAACKALGTFTLTGCEIYSSCEPCPMCLAAIYWARLDALYYGSNQQDAARAGFDDAYLYDELRKVYADRSIPSQQLLQADAWECFSAWIDHPAKVDY
ncbi:nucleoside deaminase [Acidicapsa ligni]|uniref:nucleoside deaminase n=1 Tax=Acidicapsa ligni TaxID=542300 RepID=UPI0021DFF68D|nr:nucleoside deaminase [Acidicapsa ligni]